MKSKIFMVLILLVVVFAMGCAVPTEPQQVGNTIVDEVQDGVVVQEDVLPKTVSTESIFDVESLKSDLLNIYPQQDVAWVQNGSYLEANFRKLIVIDSQSVLGKEWNGNLHFVDTLTLDKLFTPLLAEKFGSDMEFKNYKQNGMTIDQKKIENTIRVDEGFVQEYQYLNFEFDAEGHHKGSFIDPLVMYKISCAPEYAVYLRPTRASLMMPLSVANREEAYQRWEEHLVKVREDMLNKSNEVLKVCPSSGISVEDFTSTKSLSYYYPAHLEFFWDFDTHVDDAIVEQAVEDDGSTIKGKKMLRKVDLTFTNKEPYNLEGKFLVTITTESDDGKKSTFVDGKLASVNNELFKSGEVISQSFPSTVKPNFEKYTDVTVTFFDDTYYNAPINIKTFRVDVNGTVS